MVKKVNEGLPKYLVTEYKYFVDPHGSADEGGCTKFISDDPLYGIINEDVYYQGLRDLEGMENDPNYNIMEELAEIIVNEDEMGAEDGYNMEIESYNVKAITNKQAIKYQSIIDAYDKLK